MVAMDILCLMAVQAVILVFVVIITVLVNLKISKLKKTTMHQTHEIMDAVMQRLIPLEIGKEMNRIALEVLFNEDNNEDLSVEGNGA